MEKKIYRIKVVDVNPYGTNSSYVNLKLDSLEDCKKVIEIAHVANWEINLTNENFFGGELVERSAEYQKFLNKEADERAERIKDQNEKTERINALPKSYESKIQLPGGCKITYERSDDWGLGTKVLCDGNSRSLYLYKYITKDEKVQVAKFVRDMRGFFGAAEHEIHPEIIRDIVNEFNEISAKIRNS